MALDVLKAMHYELNEINLDTKLFSKLFHCKASTV